MEEAKKVAVCHDSCTSAKRQTNPSTSKSHLGAGKTSQKLSTVCVFGNVFYVKFTLKKVNNAYLGNRIVYPTELDFDPSGSIPELEMFL